MAKPSFIELGPGIPPIPVLYEDRSVLALDKPAGWLVVPSDWQRTARNLQAALESAVVGGEYWARRRGLRFLRYVHRLDAETSGVLLLAKSRGALDALSGLFESRQVAKEYSAVVHGEPQTQEWTCRLRLAPNPRQRARVVCSRAGKDAETQFRALLVQEAGPLGLRTLVQARPFTGRTHQIRVHLAADGHPVLGDGLYGPPEVEGAMPERFPLALRATKLAYTDPFTQESVTIAASTDEFLRAFGFGGQHG